ncbi:MAG: aspartate carbamoyltransferase regulatory subunit [Eubacteriales bacterium]
MIINPMQNGIVLDHITAGNGMRVYDVLGLGKLNCTVAMINNATSVKMGKKDILKIYSIIDINFDVLGYIDPGITVSVVERGNVVKRIHLQLPETIEGVIRCHNPRCITSVEQELPQIFKLTDRKKKTYRCLYCEMSAKKSENE